MITISTLAALAAAALPQSPDATAQDAPASQFGTPVHLLDFERPYPSPRLYDIDGDDAPEVLIGDLTGRVVVAERDADDPLVLGEPEPLRTADGRDLKFHNW